MNSRWTLCSAVASSLAITACGGKVIWFDGSGGSSSDASSSSKSSSSSKASSGTGSSCAALQAAMEQAIADATACSLQLTIVQCDGSAIMNDSCGCPSILLNETQPAKVSAAKAAYDAWTSAGCGPFQCGKDCLPITSGGGCVATSDATGMCEQLVF